jgi:hypothetical protein
LHCICRKPYNPDTTMFWCDKCKIWEHEKCIADAIRKAYIKANPPASGGKKSRKSLTKTTQINIAAKPGTGEVTATIHDADGKAKPESASDSKASGVEDGSSTEMPVNCLKCGSRLT